MLVLSQDAQPTLWESFLPPELFELRAELATADQLLDDERFMEPFIQRFNTRLGRPTVPVETYIRLMYLKFVYQLSYEVLVIEVADSIKWRKFCRIPLDKPVPHSTTLIKLTHKYGEEIIRELNQALVSKAKEDKIIKARKVRIDTTAVEGWRRGHNQHSETQVWHEAKLVSDPVPHQRMGRIRDFRLQS